MKQSIRTILGLAAMSFVLAACSNGNGSADGSSSKASDAATVTGPAGYHTQYSNIQHTNVTLQNLDIRTEDGQVVHVATNPMTVDLQALNGFTQGLVLDLTNVDFPGGAQTIDVAEIQTNILTDPASTIQSSDGTSCTLKSLPKTLNLYTAAPITLGHDVYHVKVGYSALNSIQLDEITTTTNKCCHKSDSKTALHDKHHGDDHGDRDHDDDDDDHDGDKNCTSGSTTTLTRECKLVNRRQPVTSIPRAVDDAF